jgi:valyl-tRNA synthetase
VADFSLVQDVVRTIRNLRTEKRVQAGLPIPAILVAGDRLSVLESQRRAISALSHLDTEQLTIVADLKEAPQGAASAAVSGVAVYLPLADLIDVEAETARVQKEMDEVSSHIERLEKLLSSPFAQRAPAAVVDKEREKLATYKETAEKLKEQMAAIKGEQ